MAVLVPQCRFCLEEAAAEEFVTPCNCEGTSRFVHESCLRRWQAEALTFEHAATCQVCLTDFSIKPDKLQWELDSAARRSDRRSRQMPTALFDAVRTNPRYDREAASRLPRALHAHLASLLTPGCLVLQTPQRAQLEARRQNPDVAHSMVAFFEAVLASRMEHWHQGVYLLAASWSGQAADGSDALIGVNLAGQPCSLAGVGVRGMNVVNEHDLRELQERLPGKPVKHAVGGPVRPDRLLSLVPYEGELGPDLPRLVHAVSGETPADGAGGVQGALFGELRDIVQVLSGRPQLRPLGAAVFQGHAVWSSQQLLSEVARGSWGLTRASNADLSITDVAEPSEVSQARWAAIWQSHVMAPNMTEVNDRSSRASSREAERLPNQASQLGCIGCTLS
eukprot:TRINITY_DN8646_c1_g1_i1.p1 TRINITY_DN8646_c1_g1~~TRINITY_DN8646_c1_g1_i1.p1  ORF type:complete len:393 (-),score=82.72 TRINITY_DN8646_c1_g1_i1:40-1218(-)